MNTDMKMNTELKIKLGARVCHLVGGLVGVRGLLGATCQATATRDNPQGLAMVDFTASDATVDRYDEVIDPAGWRLEMYRKNPVFQNAHRYGDVMHTLGKSLVTEVREGRLFQRVLFATEANPIAKVAYELYKGGFLNAVSVGFIPIRWEEGGMGKGFSRKYLEQELLELSAVAIPANPNALVDAVKSGAIDKGCIEELSEWLRNRTNGTKGTDGGEKTEDGKGKTLLRPCRQDAGSTLGSTLGSGHGDMEGKGGRGQGGGGLENRSGEETVGRGAEAGSSAPGPVTESALEQALIIRLFAESVRLLK